MKIFLIKLLAFSVLSLSVIFGITKLLSIPVEKRDFNNYNSDENLFSIKRHKHYELMIMGISHARIFSRFKNHLRVEKILNSRMINIGRGLGKCGPAAEYVYLKHFYSRGNTTKTIIIIPTPPMMFSDYLNKNAAIFEYEPFRVSLFFQYLFSKGKNKKQQLYYYLRFKYGSKWASFNPYNVESNNGTLPSYDTAAINEGFRLAYPEGMKMEVFNRNKKIIEKTVALCCKKKTRMIFMMTPAIFGKWPGHKQVFDFLYQLQKKYPIEIYDYSEVCKDRRLYLDHHHLNSIGVSWFTEKYLKPILLNQPGKK